MRKPFLIVAVLLALSVPPYSSAQKLILPAHFSSWSGQPGPQGVETEAPLTFVDLWKETGRATGEFCEYTSGGTTVDIGLEKYRDPSSAYEAYTAYIRPAMQPSTIDRISAVDGDRLFVLVGAYILQIRPTPAISTADLAALVNSVAAHADQTPLPAIRRYLPGGFTDGTQKYSLGAAGFRNALTTLKRDEFLSLADEAGFNKSAEAIVAEYHHGKDSAGLLLIEYPTPQLAEQHLRHLQQALPPSATQAGTTIERRASLLAIVLNPSSPAYAAALRGSLNYETNVTWHEPTQTITDPPLVSTLVKIILGTGFFMVMAVVLGAAFGGVRVLAKIFFPGKFFDRPEQMEVLQLGLSGKRIDPRDFY